MKTAVMYGAGNIGRGFIGKVFSEAGFHVIFVDVAAPVVDRLNADQAYPVRLVSNNGISEVMVTNVSAVNGFDTNAVAAAIANADIMATAVGVNVLPRIIPNLAAGINMRAASARPLDIIICENLIDADKYLRGLLEEAVSDSARSYLDSRIGLVEASIGRMVPVMTDEMRGDNPLRVWVEPYEELPVDKDAFKGEIPPIRTLVPFSPFGFYIRRKLFVHNMGHALCAYLGWMKGYSLISEAAADPEILDMAKAAMLDVSAALHRGYGIPKDEIDANVYDLLHRFGNRELRDSIPRVGKDPIRKLKINDRLTGAALYCIEQSIDPAHIITAIAAAFRFDNPDDEGAMEIQNHIKEHGIESAVSRYCETDSEMTARIVWAYNALILQSPISEF